MRAYADESVTAVPIGPAAAARQWLRPEWTLALVPPLLKLGLLLLVVLYEQLGWFQDHSINEHPPGWKTWFFRSDSGWYENFYRYGPYPTEQWATALAYKHLAFFPLYPLTLRLLRESTGVGSFLFWGNVLSWLLPSLVAVQLYRFWLTWAQGRTSLPTDRADPAGFAFCATLLLLLYPLGLHLYALYTEALYLALLVGALRAVQHRRWAWLVLCGGLLGLVRPNGILNIVLLGLFLLETHFWPPNQSYPLLRPKDWLRSKVPYVLLTMLIPFGLYLLWLHHTTGDALIFVRSQALWYKQPMFPLKALFRHDNWHTQFSSSFCIVVMLLMLANRNRLPVSFQVAFWLAVLLPLAAGSTVSITRYLGAAFFWFVPLARVRIVRQHLVGISSILLLLLAAAWWLWLHSSPLLY